MLERAHDGDDDVVKRKIHNRIALERVLARLFECKVETNWER